MSSLSVRRLKLVNLWLKLQLQLSPYTSHKERALALFISGCLFILGNDLIRGFLVEHGSLWLNGFMWSQSTQVCAAGRHFRSLSTNPRGALWEKNHRLLLSLPLLFSLFNPQFFPSRKIIHFSHPTMFPLFLLLKLVIKCLTGFHTKRDVFEMQTNKHLGISEVVHIGL